MPLVALIEQGFEYVNAGEDTCARRVLNQQWGESRLAE